MVVAFQGGEPTMMGLDFFARTLELERQYAAPGQPGLHHLCQGYQDFFHHVDTPMRVMADLVRRGRDATGIRDWYSVRDAKRSPDRPCTCANRRPWGQCHGAA